MAYISKRDAHAKTDGPLSKKQTPNVPKTPSTDYNQDDYDDDLDGEDEYDGENDRIFKQNLDTEFPLSGGETDEED
jgi:hypothetical protein